MRPENGQKANQLACRHFGGHRLHQKHPAVLCSNPAEKTGDGGAASHNCQQDKQRLNKRRNSPLRPFAEASRKCQPRPKKQTNPPGRYNSPAQTEQSWGVCVENRWMPYREIFHTETRGDLVVDDAVDYCRCDAQKDYFDCLHLSPFHDGLPYSFCRLPPQTAGNAPVGRE